MVYLCRGKPKNSGPFSLTVVIIISALKLLTRLNECLCLRVSGMEMDCNLKNLGQASQVVSARLQKIDINSPGLFSLCELRLYLPLDVQRQRDSWATYKLPTTNFRIDWTKNP